MLGEYIRERLSRRRARPQKGLEPIDVQAEEVEVPALRSSDLETKTIELDDRKVVVKNHFLLRDFINGLNIHDPGAELLVSTRQDDFRVLPGSLTHPPSGICTDGVVNRVNRHIGFNTLDVSDATYLAWVATEHKPRAGFSTYLTSEGSIQTYFMMSRQPIHELREQANAIPGNTIKLVHWR